MLNTQAGDRLPNSAANSLPARNTYKNSATGQHRKIVAKPMILNKLSTLNGCLSAAERRFLPAVRENPTRLGMPEPAARGQRRACELRLGGACHRGSVPPCCETNPNEESDAERSFDR